MNIGFSNSNTIKHRLENVLKLIGRIDFIIKNWIKSSFLQCFE